MKHYLDFPDAIAYVRGGESAPDLFGEVAFFQNAEDVLVVTCVSGLPKTSETGFFALHIHEGANCAGDGFPNTGTHYNPDGTIHPKHRGDLPPLLFCNGGAYLATKTARFSVEEIIGRTVVIHSGADDFHSQPSGNAGEKIACGTIRRG